MIWCPVAKPNYCYKYLWKIKVKSGWRVRRRIQEKKWRMVRSGESTRKSRKNSLMSIFNWWHGWILFRMRTFGSRMELDEMLFVYRFEEHISMAMQYISTNSRTSHLGNSTNNNNSAIEQRWINMEAFWCVL